MGEFGEIGLRGDVKNKNSEMSSSLLLIIF